MEVKVSNLESLRSGSPVANQYVIRTPEGEYFQSYQSIVAYYDYARGLVLDPTYWNYSRTTSKYLHQFLLSHGVNITTVELKKRIADGSIVTEDLNIN